MPIRSAVWGARPHAIQGKAVAKTNCECCGPAVAALPIATVGLDERGVNHFELLHS